MQHNSGVTMDLRALRHFVRLADVLNFSRAAEQCAVTPSTLSREINRLEEECGAPLFERNHHSVSLTPRGQEFLSFARTVESAWREFRNSGTEKSLSGVIKVYCSVTASYLILPEILTLFRREYPDVEITLETGDAANAVQKIEDMDADVAERRQSAERHAAGIGEAVAEVVGLEQQNRRAMRRWRIQTRGTGRPRVDRITEKATGGNRSGRHARQ